MIRASEVSLMTQPIRLDEAPLLLLVEDLPEDIELFQIALSRGMAGRLYVLQTVSTLMDAKTYMRHIRPDLVILDLKLPNGQGLMTLENLLEDQPRASILVLTGNSDTDMAIRCIHSGADCYLAKEQIYPDYRNNFEGNPDFLVQRIFSTIARRKRQNSEIEDLLLNPPNEDSSLRQRIETLQELSRRAEDEILQAGLDFRFRPDEIED